MEEIGLIVNENAQISIDFLKVIHENENWQQCGDQRPGNVNEIRQISTVVGSNCCLCKEGWHKQLSHLPVGVKSNVD